jgi:hypothetical protein
MKTKEILGPILNHHGRARTMRSLSKPWLRRAFLTTCASSTAITLLAAPTMFSRVKAVGCLQPSFPRQARCNDTVCKHNGVVLSGKPVKMLFWGSSWNGSQKNRIKTVVSAIMGSQYLTGLIQYSVTGISLDQSCKTIIDLDPKPQGFYDTQVQAVINEAGRDSRYLYAVFPPIGRVPLDQAQNGGGYHDYISGANIAYLVVPTVPPTPNQPDQTGLVFSHELVEACTNPNPHPGRGQGWYGETCAQAAQPCEIADLCPGPPGVINGIFVSQYWSLLSGGCSAPGATPANSNRRTRAQRD